MLELAPWPKRRFSDKEVQRDAKLVSYDVVEKNTKPYVQVQIGDDNKACLCFPAVATHRRKAPG